MTVTVTRFVRQTLALDAIVTGAAAVLMIAGSSILPAFTGLPEGLLFWAGIVLVPYVAMLALLARQTRLQRLWLIDVIALNGLWVVASLGILVTGAVTPTLLGHAFVLAQAATVALFAILQAKALSQATTAVTA